MFALQSCANNGKQILMKTKHLQQAIPSVTFQLGLYDSRKKYTY